MDHRLANLLALLLIASGVLFVAYAAHSLRHSSDELSTNSVSNHVEARVPRRAEEPVPKSESESGALPAPQTNVSPVSADAPVSAPTMRPPDSSDSSAARRQAAILWVALALPLLFITFVLIVVLRRLRPPPMKHTGPSDTTDLWQEAGKRMK
jgi:hypothetical protein